MLCFIVCRNYSAAWEALEAANIAAGAEALYDAEKVEDRLRDTSRIFLENISFPLQPSPKVDHSRSSTWSSFMGGWWSELRRRLFSTFSNKKVQPEDMRPIFVLGLPRSGTSLLEQVLASHPSVWGAGEGSPMASIARDLIADIADKGKLTAEGLKELRSKYIANIARRVPSNKAGVSWVVDKGLGNVW